MAYLQRQRLVVVLPPRRRAHHHGSDGHQRRRRPDRADSVRHQPGSEMTMQQAKTAGLAFLVALTVLGAGYLWGARGRWAAQDRLAVVERQAALSETRRLTLAGQMALTRLNFGEAAGLFESARAGADARRARARARRARRPGGRGRQGGPGPDRGARPGRQARPGRGGEGRRRAGAARPCRAALARPAAEAALLIRAGCADSLMTWVHGPPPVSCRVDCVPRGAGGRARLAVGDRSGRRRRSPPRAPSSPCRRKRLKTSSQSACPTPSSPRLIPKSD